MTQKKIPQRCLVLFISLNIYQLIFLFTFPIFFFPILDKIGELVNAVRSMLSSMGDGEISISPYDTAWVALVADEGRPRFPASLEWISRNQLSDGSWGDARTFSIFDRILNTLACVVALRFWDSHRDKTDRGSCVIFKKKSLKFGLFYSNHV